MPRGSVVTELVSLLDIYPTLLDIARIPQPGPGLLAGASLGPMLGLVPPTASGRANAAAPPARKPYVVSQFHSNLGNTGSFCIVHGTLKYITFGTLSLNATFGGYQPQLFDVSLDPHEMTDLSRTRPADVARLDALLRSELGSGFNAASPGAGDYDEIDAQVKRLQQRTFLDYFVRSTSSLRSLWAQMLLCEDDINAATRAGEHPLLRVYAGDAGTDVPCATNDAPLDRIAAQAYFAAQDSGPLPGHRSADLDLEADRSAAGLNGRARSSESFDDFAFVGDADGASGLSQTLADLGRASPLRQMLARSYTGFDAADWRKLKYWAVQDL
jgi:arylsulfatase K